MKEFREEVDENLPRSDLNKILEEEAVKLGLFPDTISKDGVYQIRISKKTGILKRMIHIATINTYKESLKTIRGNYQENYGKDIEKYLENIHSRLNSL